MAKKKRITKNTCIINLFASELIGEKGIFKNKTKDIRNISVYMLAVLCLVSKQSTESLFQWYYLGK